MTKNGNFAIVELNKNVLRVYCSSGEKSTCEVDLQGKNYSEQLCKAVKEFKAKVEKLVYLLPEKEVYNRFFIVSSDEKDVNLYLRGKAEAFVGRPLSELHVTFQKVSPFVYQFIGIDSAKLNLYKDASLLCGIRNYSLIPVSFIFSTFVGKFDPFFFILKATDEFTLIASEFGGVYYSGTFETSIDVNHKLTSLIDELSSFNRIEPVRDVYFYGEEISLGKTFNSVNLNSLIVLSPEYTGFEKIKIAERVINTYPNIFASYFNLTSQTNVKQTSEKQFPVIKSFILAVFISCLILSGLVFFFSKKVDMKNVQESVKESSSSPTVLAEKVVEATKEAVLNKSELRIRVENGTGLTNVASKGKELLTQKGYLVVEIGNAQRFDYNSTEIQIKDSKKLFGDGLVKDLAPSYKSVLGKALDESKSYDVLVIIGKQ